MFRGVVAIVAIFLSLGFVASAAPVVSNGTGGGAWDAPETWSGHRVPSPADDITILPVDTVTAGSLDVGATLLVEGQLRISGGAVTLGGAMTTDSGAVSIFDACAVTIGTLGSLRINGSVDFVDTSKSDGAMTLINHGKVIVDKSGTLRNAGLLDNIQSLENDGTLDNEGRFENHGVFENAGQFENAGVFNGNAPTQALPVGAVIWAAVLVLLGACVVWRSRRA